MRIGRPFGGTGFLWNKKYSLVIKPKIEHRHDRVTVVEINDKRNPIIVINAYFPYLNNAELDAHISEYRDVIGFIDHVLDSYAAHSVLLLGDFNCNFFNHTHPFYSILHDFIKKR